MLTTTTKAVMLLAACAICFALVCPVAVTPMPVQKQGAADLGTAPIAINAAIVVAFFIELVSPSFVPEHDSPDTNDLNCVRNC